MELGSTRELAGCQMAAKCLYEKIPIKFSANSEVFKGRYSSSIHFQTLLAELLPDLMEENN
jgi:hypothetical protein